MVFARKRFGQHFLQDPFILEQLMATIAPQADEHFIEIGPGHGELTHYLVASQPARLDLIEIDRDLVRQLQRQFAPISTVSPITPVSSDTLPTHAISNKANAPHSSADATPHPSTDATPHPSITLYQADVLSLDFNTLLSPTDRVRIVGNLPYNISTPVLFKLMTLIPQVIDMHFLLQKEVVDRLCAPVGSHAYGRLAIMAQYYCAIEGLFDVPPSAFSPPPKVMSRVVRLVPRCPSPAAIHVEHFADIVRIAFTHRRKTIRNALSSLQLTAADWAALNLDDTRRPQTLTVAEYIALSNYCVRQSQHHPPL